MYTWTTVGGREESEMLFIVLRVMSGHQAVSYCTCVVHFITLFHPLIRIPSPGRETRHRSLKLDFEIHSTAELKLKLTKYNGCQQWYSEKFIEKESSLSKWLSRLISEARSRPPSTPRPTVINNGGHAMSRLDKHSSLVSTFI